MKKSNKITNIIFIAFIIICFMTLLFLMIKDFLSSYVQIILFICAIVIFAALALSIYYPIKKKRKVAEDFLNYITKLSGDKKEDVQKRINEILDKNGISAFLLTNSYVANFIFREYFNQDKTPTMVEYKEDIGQKELEILKKYPVRKIFTIILIAGIILFIPFAIILGKAVATLDEIMQLVILPISIIIYFIIFINVLKINNNKYSSKLYSYIHTVADYISLQTGVPIDSVLYKLYALRNKYTSDDFKNDSVKRIIEEYNKIYVD